VDRLRAYGRRVLFVADGTNDAPAMATADLGIAMGRRDFDLALQTADVVLLHEGLPRVLTGPVWCTQGVDSPLT
jgi:P-type E1-E2 ATPase